MDSPNFFPLQRQQNSAGTYNQMPTAAQARAKQMASDLQYRKQAINIIIIASLVTVMFILYWRNSDGQETIE